MLYVGCGPCWSINWGKLLGSLTPGDSLPLWAIELLDWLRISCYNGTRRFVTVFTEDSLRPIVSQSHPVLFPQPLVQDSIFSLVFKWSLTVMNPAYSTRLCNCVPGTSSHTLNNYVWSFLYATYRRIIILQNRVWEFNKIEDRPSMNINEESYWFC
jgi:hypothetical protein